MQEDIGFIILRSTFQSELEKECRFFFFFFKDLRTQSGAVHEDLYLLHAPKADSICIIAYAKKYRTAPSTI